MIALHGSAVLYSPTHGPVPLPHCILMSGQSSSSCCSQVGFWQRVQIGQVCTCHSWCLPHSSVNEKEEEKALETITILFYILICSLAYQIRILNYITIRMMIRGNQMPFCRIKLSGYHIQDHIILKTFFTWLLIFLIDLGKLRSRRLGFWLNLNVKWSSQWLNSRLAYYNHQHQAT